MKSLTLASVILAQALGQAGSIAGTWTAEFEGRTFVRLEFSSVDRAITGGITLGNFELDKAGVVRRASEPPSNLTPISDVRQRGAITNFSVAGTDEPDRFEFRLVGPGRAELTLLLSDDDREELAAEGIPAPRPIPLLRR